MRIHKNLTQEKWSSLLLRMQLANVGTDVDRAISWKNREDMEYSVKAFERALELLDLTISDDKNNNGKRRELLRVREALVDYFIYSNEYNTSDEFWHKYFFAFAYAAALEREKKFK
jgi:hypothetical protein